MSKIIVGILIGFLSAFIVYKIVIDIKSPSTVSSQSPNPGDFQFLARRIFLDNPNDVIVNFIDLRNKIKNEVSGESDIGVYFEYLPTGVHIGVNDREEFYRASLVKLPLVMRAYKMMEIGEIKRDEKLTVRRDLLDNTYGELWKTGAGTDLNISEVYNLILTKSDNTAYNMLLDRVNQALKNTNKSDEEGIVDIYDYFDISKDNNNNNQFSISPRSYASILKSLFFSSYLNYHSSNEIVDMMTQSVFNNSMSKYISKDIKVAHKVGIYQGEDMNKWVHSDCGIVYIPKRPYILCVMVKSADQEKSYQKIADISKIVFDYLANANK